MNYLYLLGTIFFTVYGQIVLKWQISNYGKLPEALVEKLIFLLKLFLNPWILSGFIAAFIASLFWMAAMTRFEISFAYPFMSLAFVLVLILGGLVLGEIITLQKIIGLIVIIIGIIIVSR